MRRAAAVLLLVLLAATPCLSGCSTDLPTPGPDRPVQSDTPAPSDKTDPSEQPGKPDPANKPDGQDQGDTPSKADEQDRIDTDQQTKPDQSDTADEPDKTDEPDTADPKDEEKTPPVTLPASNTSVLAAGVVNDADVRLRSGPGTGHDILGEFSSGTPLAVLGWEDGWYRVRCGGSDGYMSDEYVTIHDTGAALSCFAIVTTDALNLRSAPSTSGSIVTTLAEGDCLDVTGFEGGWFRASFDGSPGYVSGDYVDLTDTKPAPPTPPPTDEEEGDVPSQPPADDSCDTGSEDTGNSDNSGDTGSEGGSDNTGTAGQAIADYAQEFLGVPYVWGGTTPSGFDCSGFIQYVFRHFGYELPRGTNAQLNCGTAVAKSELQPGDIIFFRDPEYAEGGPTSHAGIYIGGGEFIHASTYNGNERVQIHPLSNAYYTRVYAAARRIAG